MLCKEPLSLYRLTGAGFFYSWIMDELTVDEYGFVYLGSVRICRITNEGALEFLDRSKLRSAGRGSNYVYVTPEAFYHFIIEATVRATLKASL